MQKIRRFEIWVADLNPRIGTEAGKRRPVLVVQTDLLNNILHPCTIICPITTKVKKGSDHLRVHLKKGEGNLNQDCDIMIDQLRSIDNKRLTIKIGRLSSGFKEVVKENISIVLDLES